MPPLSPVFSGRAGVYVVGGGAFSRATWPLGRVILDAEDLTVGTFLRSYRVRVADIDRIRRGMFSVIVEHHAADVPGLIQLTGFRLFSRLQEAIQQHHLKVEME